MGAAIPDKRRYLLIPVPPTPNGRLHLGHMAGPYLRMDMLRRRLEQLGHDVALWTGTDSHDSFVLYRAHQRSMTAPEVCRKYHKLIEEDLAAFDIQVDGFVDTLEGDGRRMQEEHAADSVNRLCSLGLAESGEETILFDAENRLPIVGTWLAGRCPQCGANCIGYFCEGCFTHNQPGELRETSSRRGDRPLSARRVETVFLRIADRRGHLALLDRMGVAPKALEVVDRMLAPPVRQFRLTVPIDWGLAYGADRYGQPRSIFEVLWEIYTYSERKVRSAGAGVAAWREESDAEVVVACGVDNTIAILMGGVGVYDALPGAKPPAHVHINYFAKLNGTKFSTNRNHAIWAGDLAAQCRDGVDGVRMFLARISPEDAESNFDVDAFVGFYNETYRQEWIASINRALADNCNCWDDRSLWLEAIESEWRAMDGRLSAKTVRVSAAVRIFEKWLSMYPTVRHRASALSWWLKGVGLLGYPFAPNLSRAVWEGIGHTGIPALSDMAAEPSSTPPRIGRVAEPEPITSEAVIRLIGKSC